MSARKGWSYCVPPITPRSERRVESTSTWPDDNDLEIVVVRVWQWWDRATTVIPRIVNRIGEDSGSASIVEWTPPDIDADCWRVRCAPRSWTGCAIPCLLVFVEREHTRGRLDCNTQTLTRGWFVMSLSCETITLHWPVGRTDHCPWCTDNRIFKKKERKHTHIVDSVNPCGSGFQPFSWGCVPPWSDWLHCHGW